MDLELYMERIEQYENGTMSADERSGFEAALATNAEMQAALNLYRQANDVIEQRIENDLREQFREWDQADGETPMITASPARSRVVTMQASWIRFAAAASVALLMGWFGLRWAHNQYSDDALFAAQYEKPGDSTFRGANTERALQPGFDAWNRGELAGAADFFSNVPASDEYYAEAQYYLGHLNLQQQRYDAAITAFAHAIERPASKFREKAEWNRVLTYIAAGRTEELAFETYLGKIADNPAHSYQAQAKVLQQKLESVWR